MPKKLRGSVTKRNEYKCTRCDHIVVVFHKNCECIPFCCGYEMEEVVE